MKTIKKLTMLCSALLLAFGVAGFAACADAPTSSSAPSENSTPNSSSTAPELPDEGQTIEACYEDLDEHEVSVLVNAPTPVTVEATAGLYYVTSYDGSTSFNEAMPGVFFDLEEDGELAFDITYYDFFAEETYETTATYWLYKILPANITGNFGTMTLLADGAITPVTLSVDEAGIYSFYVNQEVAFYSGLDFDGYLGHNPYYTVFAESAGNVTLYVGGLESSYGDVELGFSLEKTTPTAITAETETLTLNAIGDRPFEFTASQEGAYKLTYGNSNISVAAFNEDINRIDYEFGASYFEFDYTGDPIVFFAKYTGFDFSESYTANVTLERIGDVGYRSPVSPDDLLVYPDANVYSSVVPANSVELNIPLTVIVNAGTGNWALNWDNDAVTVYYNGEVIENGYEFEIELDNQKPSFTVHNATKADIILAFSLTDLNATVEPATALELGENAINVTVLNYIPQMTVCEFQAEKAGKYRIYAAEGEENADVYDSEENYLEVLPFEFDLAENDVYTFYVASLNAMIESDVIDLIIEYYDETAGAWVQE